MNANQIINMVIRMVMRKAINGGINAGMKKVSGVRNAQAVPRPQPRHAQMRPPQASAAQPAELGPREAKIARKLAAKRAARAAEVAARSNTG